MSEIKLHLNAVSPELLELLISIQSNDSFKDLRLVGGTALALQYGHRKSIDLDFFGSLELTNSDIAMEFSKFGKVEGLKNSPSL